MTDNQPACSASTSGDGDDAGSEQPPPPDTGGGCEIEFADPGGAGARLDLSWIETHLRRAAAHVGTPVTRIGVTLVDDRRMTALHVEHQDIDETTDVLTFPLSERGGPIDVDIAVCVDEARRQAATRGHAVERELLLYCLHGVLHCAGFDDARPEDFTAMHEREDRILDAIGVGATFHRDDSSRGDGRPAP